MDKKVFSQEEVNRIVTARVSREREKLAKDFENRMKRCMASLHLMLHQELCEMKRDTTAETQEPLLQATQPNEQGPVMSHILKRTK
ncbi:MAG TPA: hypothetical protein DEB31_10185 [Clostridiales bacterium]|nr:hypothetical protein [Clostridiales bacterium]